MKRQLSNSITSFIIVAALVISPVTYSFFSPIWFITDFIRDGNWWLKMTREAIFQDERMSNHNEIMEQAKTLSEGLNDQKNANQSAEIQAKTSAISITENNYSEERYSAPFQSKETCKIINESLDKVNTTLSESCNFEKQKEESTFHIITGAMNNETPTNISFFNHIKTESKNSSQNGKDKQFLETFSMQLSDTSQILNNYSLLNEDELVKASNFIELIFGSDIRTPSAEQISLIGLPQGPIELQQLRKSLLYKGFIDDSLKRRTLINNKARDAAFINDGSTLAHSERIESLNQVQMTPEITRHLALYYSKSLNSTLTKLEKSLRSETLQALKLKDIRINHED
ncbi:hypothetical protein [Aliivibrio finisterrensis]|uniref:Uncharacterized protein n=1 Tax=Aliivibrio finisterrensis TaxID=511998 RepID=A0ABY0I4X6_9GAMM|nr:hypothetical protein [Aliivibrio finisterrensis]RYU63836.1 hypothetical protein ERW53_12415 [Aliivibrio finisterrensis]RYU82773.1 hypothetical protein ERW52_14240 [Aliivibrio finisterrensis]